MKSIGIEKKLFHAKNSYFISYYLFVGGLERTADRRTMQIELKRKLKLNPEQRKGQKNINKQLCLIRLLNACPLMFLKNE